MAHIFHMNLQTYNANTAYPAVGAGAGIRTPKQIQLNATLNAYQVANGPVEVAGFTEVFIADGHNPANVSQALNDLATNLGIPTNGAGARHIFAARCGSSALMNSTEVVAIVINGNAVINDTGQAAFYMYQMCGRPITLECVYVPPFTVVLNGPWMQPLDYRCIVYAGYTLGGITRRIGFAHNVYVQEINRAFFMRLVRPMMRFSNLNVCGGDFNAAPAANVLSPRRRQFYYDPGVPTTAGGNIYDWWTTTAAQTAPGGGAPIVTYTAAAPGGMTGSDHRGVGLQIA